MVWENAHGTEVTFKLLSIDMFCENVRRIILTGHFAEPEVACTQSLLHPKIRRMKMADLSEASPFAYTNCRGRIGAHLECKVSAQICCYAL